MSRCTWTDLHQFEATSWCLKAVLDAFQPLVGLKPESSDSQICGETIWPNVGYCRQICGPSLASGPQWGSEVSSQGHNSSGVQGLWPGDSPAWRSRSAEKFGSNRSCNFKNSPNCWWNIQTFGKKMVCSCCWWVSHQNLYIFLFDGKFRRAVNWGRWFPSSREDFLKENAQRGRNSLLKSPSMYWWRRDPTHRSIVKMIRAMELSLNKNTVYCHNLL